MRAAVVGAGFMGRWHVRLLRRLDEPLVAIVDPDLHRAAALAPRGTRTFSDLEACLQASEVDVVHVCTPVDSHVELVQTAFSHRCHALVEKPLAPSLADTQKLMAGSEAAGLLLAPVHQFPFQRGFRELVARSAALGELVRVAYRTCSVGGEGKKADERRAILVGILPHAVSLFSRLLPELDAADLELQVYDEDDLALAGSSGGAQLEVTISLRGRPVRNELEAIGTRGTAVADLFGGYAVFESGRTSRLAKVDRPLRLGTSLVGRGGINLVRRTARRETAYPGLRELIAEFHRAAARGAPAPIPRDETLTVAALMDAVMAKAAA